MSPIAGQTAGSIGLKFFVDTHGWPCGVLGLKKFEIFFRICFSTGNAGPFSYLSYIRPVFTVCLRNFPLFAANYK